MISGLFSDVPRDRQVVFSLMGAKRTLLGLGPLGLAGFQPPAGAPIAAWGWRLRGSGRPSIIHGCSDLMFLGVFTSSAGARLLCELTPCSTR